MATGEATTHADLVKKYPLTKSFTTHGLVLRGEAPDGTQVNGDCPLCGKADKFFLDPDKRLWDCKKCGAEGNLEKFFLLKSRIDQDNTPDSVLQRLADNRKLTTDTLRRWGVGWNGRAYTIPLFNKGIFSGVKGCADLRRYNIGRKVMGTYGGHHGFAMSGTAKASNTVYVTEGEWDGMAWDEVLAKTGQDGVVLSVAGAGNFPKQLLSFFVGKKIVWLFDNDLAGQRGVYRAWNLMQAAGCREQARLVWPEGTPEEYDIRDLYGERKAEGAFQFVAEHCTAEVPTDPMRPAGTPSGKGLIVGKIIEESTFNGKPVPVKKVIAAYRKWLHLPDTEVLEVMFGTFFANRIEADPFWLFMVAPPGGSKTELLMTASEAPKVYTLSSLTPHALISGAQLESGDPSLLPHLLGKTLIIKDFTAILTMNSVMRDEIFGILRDAYDGRIEKVFGNGMIRRYEGHFGIIAGVTPAIESVGNMSSVLGERFLKYRLRQQGTITKGRDQILRSLDNVTSEQTMRHELKQVAIEVLSRPVTRDIYPTVTDEFKQKLVDMAQWVAACRGTVNRERYTREIQFKPTQEVGTRLAKQLFTFALGVGIFKNEDVLSESTYNTVCAIARGTAPDRVEEVIKQLYVRRGKERAHISEISEWTRFPTETIRPLLQDMTLLRLLETVQGNGQERGYWRLTESMRVMTDRLGLYGAERAWIKNKRG